MVSGVSKKAQRALEEAIHEAGSIAALSRALNVRPNTISMWRNRGVPCEWVVDLCRAVDWAVHPNQLRPDVFPPGIPEAWKAKE